MSLKQAKPSVPDMKWCLSKNKSRRIEKMEKGKASPSFFALIFQRWFIITR